MGIESYYLAPGSNTALFPEGMSPSSVNDGMRTVQTDLRTFYNNPIWIQYGIGDGSYTAAYASASSFTIANADVTDAYHVGRRVKIFGSLTGTVYGVITSSSYSDPNTTVTVDIDASGVLESESLTIWLSAIPATNSPIPGTTGTLGDIIGYSIGTSGDTVPLLSGANTWADDQAFSGNVTVGGTLGVTGAATLADDASVGGDLTVTGTINTYTLTSMSAASFADQSTAEAGVSTTAVMNPLGVAYALADDDLLIGNRTSAATALATMEVVTKLTGGGLRRVLLSAIKTLVNTPDYTLTAGTIPSGAGILTATHGLGAEPAHVEWIFRCGTTDQGYSVGDAIEPATSDTSDNQQTLTIGKNETTAFIVIPATITIRNKSSFAQANMTKSSWTAEVRCWL